MTEDKDTTVLHEGQLVEVVKEAVLDSEVGEYDNVIDEVYVTGEDDPELVSSADVLQRMLQQTMKGFDTERIHKEVNNSALIDVTKAVVEGSTQSDREIGAGDISNTEVVEPPYPPDLISSFLEVDVTHYRSVLTKVTDSVLREYTLDPVRPVEVEVEESKENLRTQDIQKAHISEGKEMLSPEDVSNDSKKILDFIRTSNEIIGFEGVLQKAAMDYEAVGWAAIEVIRSVDSVIRRIAHIPATRIRVLRGWKGFVEMIDNGKFIYYQNFGDKIKSATRKNPITNARDRYDPDLDGELESANISVSYIDKNTGKPTKDITKAASELLWVPKHNSNTIYYGFSDIVPAIGDVLANSYIRDYLLQFFDHNTIPRYAIVIKGAKLSPKVQQAITKYFSTHVKGRAHKTLLIPINQVRGDVSIDFVKLADDEKEGSFQETRKNNAQGIMTAHGTSPAILGINDAAALGSGKGLSQAEIYKDRIITPSQLNWAAVLNNMFRLGLGVTSVLLKFDPLDIRDKEAEMRRLTTYMEKGVLSINQVLKITGMGEPIKGGDRPFFKLGNEIVFIEELATMPTMMERKEEKNKRLVEQQDKDRELNKNEDTEPGKEREFGDQFGKD